MKTSPEDTVSFFGAHVPSPYGTLSPSISTHTVPSGTGSTLVPHRPYPEINWPYYNADLEPYAPKITGPVVTPTPAQEKQVQDMLKAHTAIKHDHDKTDWSLMPWEAVEEINKVLEFGRNKYNEKNKQGPSSWNWAKGTGLGRLRVLNAVFRHLFAYARGEKFDPESNLSHLSHAACGLLFMIYYNTYPDKYPENE